MSLRLPLGHRARTPGVSVSLIRKKQVPGKESQLSSCELIYRAVEKVGPANTDLEGQ